VLVPPARPGPARASAASLDVLVSAPPDAMASRRFFDQAIRATKVTPMEVATDQARTYPAVLEELLAAAWHRTEQYGMG
jgi:transposase-like protein